MTKAQRDIKGKLRVLNYAKKSEMLQRSAGMSEFPVKVSIYGKRPTSSTVKKL